MGKGIAFWLLLLVALPVLAEDDDKSFWDQFKDPEDGKFDLTAGSGSASGFLPVVIPFNDPAFGAGLTMALVYFHPRASSTQEEEQDSAVPPSMTFGGGAFSENGSWVAAAGHIAIWKEGRMRYKGALVRASADLDFYGIGAGGGLNDNPISFNIEGGGIVQELQFQLGKTRFFLGSSFVFLNTETRFDIASGLPEEGKTTDAGLTAFLTYDSRDNTFTPNAGTYGKIQISRHAEALGGDFNYTSEGLAAFHYQPVFAKRLILAFRLDYQHASDDSPFYALPWVKLRGIPAFRFLGNHVLTSEIEPRWKIDERWSVLAFAGTGRAAREYNELGDAEKASSYGAGFRYLLSRKLGLAGGMDVARGPEESTIHIIFGSAW